MDRPPPDVPGHDCHDRLVPPQHHAALSRDLLPDYLALTHDRCPRCKGSVDPLRALCLQCRTPLALGITTERPFAIAWSVALACAALSVGYGFIIAAWSIIRRSIPDFGHIRPALIGAMIMGTLMAGATLLLLFFRPRFVNLPTPLQWTLATAAVATVLVPFAWLVIAQR